MSTGELNRQQFAAWIGRQPAEWDSHDDWVKWFSEKPQGEPKVVVLGAESMCKPNEIGFEAASLLRGARDASR